MARKVVWDWEGKKIETRDNLESILKQIPTLDIDIMEFFLIARCGSYMSNKIFYRCSEEIQELIGHSYKERMASIPLEMKKRETKLVEGLRPYYGVKNFETIGEFKKKTEKEGFLYRGVSLGAIATFNTRLGEYKIESIKVPQWVAPGYLKKYGLEKVSNGYSF